MPDTIIDGGASPMMGGMDAENTDSNMAPDMGMTPMDGDANQFDADFDAGVDANEESDPKRYIQQLTGKLSQSLRKYNEGLPQPDADLNKYVAGMIVKQCIEGLTPEDTQDILDKVKTDETPGEDGQEGAELGMQQEPMEQQAMADPSMEQQPPMNENASRRQAITSRYEEFTKNDNEGCNDTVPNRNSYHKRPWVGKVFKA